MAALAEQVATFKSQLQQIRTDFGSSWAVLVDNKVAGAFEDFESAALYALKHLADRDYLIRHTDDVLETVPFMVIEG